jgi:hypothetical protein
LKKRNHSSSRFFLRASILEKPVSFSDEVFYGNARGRAACAMTLLTDTLWEGPSDEREQFASFLMLLWGDLDAEKGWQHAIGSMPMSAPTPG